MKILMLNKNIYIIVIVGLALVMMVMNASWLLVMVLFTNLGHGRHFGVMDLGHGQIGIMVF